MFRSKKNEIQSEKIDEEKLKFVKDTIGSSILLMATFNKYNFTTEKKKILSDIYRNIKKELFKIDEINAAYTILISCKQEKQTENMFKDKADLKESQVKEDTPSFCSQCGRKLDSNSKFCAGCGVKVSDNKVRSKRFFQSILQNKENEDVRTHLTASDKALKSIKLFGILANVLPTLFIFGILLFKGQGWGGVILLAIIIGTIQTILTIVALIKINKLCNVNLYKYYILSILMNGVSIAIFFSPIIVEHVGINRSIFVTLYIGSLAFGLFASYLQYKALNMLSIISQVKQFQIVGIVGISVYVVSMLVAYNQFAYNKSSFLNSVNWLLILVYNILFYISWYKIRGFTTNNILPQKNQTAFQKFLFQKW